MRKLAVRLALLFGSTAVFLVLAELAFRALGPAPDPSFGAQYFAGPDHREIDPSSPEGIAYMLANFEHVPDAPRPRPMPKPNTMYRICYRGMAGSEGLDEHGCVAIEINACGIRDDDAVCEPKRDGELRVVCLGDSTTLGWGVRNDDCWVRRVGERLHEARPEVTMVNCGASGTMLPDEYLLGLRQRFARFEPDLVLVTMCPNDLLPVNGAMLHFDPRLPSNSPPPGWWRRHSRIIDRIARLREQRNRTRLDPSRDWVGEMLALPPERYPPHSKEAGDVYWGSGVPQQALRDLQSWCAERSVRFGVMLWPFLQQLDSREVHPLTPLHDRVAAFCAEHDMPFLDLLDVFLGEEPSGLWVSPRDQHGNPRSQRLAAPAIADFVRGLLPPG